MSTEFWYECANCGTGFPYAPNNPSDFVFEHCGHKCLQCSALMNWDEPTENGLPQPCTHADLKEPNSVLPKKGGRIGSGMMKQTTEVRATSI